MAFVVVYSYMCTTQFVPSPLPLLLPSCSPSSKNPALHVLPPRVKPRICGHQVSDVWKLLIQGEGSTCGEKPAWGTGQGSDGARMASSSFLQLLLSSGFVLTPLWSTQPNRRTPRPPSWVKCLGLLSDWTSQVTCLSLTQTILGSEEPWPHSWGSGVISSWRTQTQEGCCEKKGHLL